MLLNLIIFVVEGTVKEGMVHFISSYIQYVVATATSFHWNEILSRLCWFKQLFRGILLFHLFL